MGCRWNCRDLDAVLACYSADAVLTSPEAPHWFARDDGTIRGTDELRDYLEVEFNALPSGTSRSSTRWSADGVTVVYARENGAVVAQVMNLDAAGRIRVARAFFQGLVFPERPRD